MAEAAQTTPSEETGELSGAGSRLAILLAMAMFVLVVDTSLMNVSISAVVRDLGTTVSAVQSAIALEALVSAAFILTGSKVTALIGRRPAIVVGAAALALFAWWLVRRKRAGKPSLIDPDLFRSALFRLGISGQLLQQISLGGLMIVLPIYLQMVFEYNALQAGLSIAPLSLSMFFVA